MKKDIEIPQVENVHVAAVRQFNKEHRTHDWNAYIINNTGAPLETILIRSKGLSKTKVTSELRHKLELLPAKAYAKIEFMEDSVLTLDNTFQVTFFQDGKLFDKKFVFKAGSIKEAKTVELPVIPEAGILAE